MMKKYILHNDLSLIHLRNFIKESNEIESIFKFSMKDQLDVYINFLEISFEDLCVLDIEEFVKQIQPQVKLREEFGCNVRVGSHFPPPGGANINYALADLIDLIKSRTLHPVRVYGLYENLHPFTDGNGRSGRLLWLWYMFNNPGKGGLLSPNINVWLELGFLKSYHYQVLDHNDGVPR